MMYLHDATRTAVGKTLCLLHMLFRTVKVRRQRLSPCADRIRCLPILVAVIPWPRFVAATVAKSSTDRLCRAALHDRHDLIKLAVSFFPPEVCVCTWSSASGMALCFTFPLSYHTTSIGTGRAYKSPGAFPDESILTQTIACSLESVLAADWLTDGVYLCEKPTRVLTPHSAMRQAGSQFRLRRASRTGVRVRTMVIDAWTYCFFVWRVRLYCSL